jgi:hypothetical protein
MRIAWAEVSCSAWDSRSAAIHRGSGDHVDADDPEDLALGRRHVGVARADDLVHGGDGPGAVGQGRDRLGAADPVDLVHAGPARRGQDQGGDPAVRGRHGHDQALDPGDLGR